MNVRLSITKLSLMAKMLDSDVLLYGRSNSKRLSDNISKWGPGWGERIGLFISREGEWCWELSNARLTGEIVNTLDWDPTDEGL